MKKALSLLLAIVMVFSLLPVSAFAAETKEGGKITFTTTFTEGMTVGATFTVTATLSDNPGFASFTHQLKWNEKVLKFNGFDLDEDGYPTDSDIFGRWKPTVNDETATITAASDSDYKKNGLIYTAKFEIIAGGDLGLGLTTTEFGEKYTFADANRTDIIAQLDFSAISGLKAAGASAAPDMPEDAPFTAITTDAGNILAVEYVEDVDFNYSTVPYYIVTIPEDATTAYVTAPDQVVMEDWNTGAIQATGYAANLEDMSTPLYISYNYEDTADGPKVEIPMNMVASDWSGEVELDFVNTHAFGIENASYACLGLISFVYEEGGSEGGEGDGGEEEEPTVSQIPEGAVFLDAYTDKDQPVQITVVDGRYHVEVPQDATKLHIAYPQDKITIDEFKQTNVDLSGVSGIYNDTYPADIEDDNTVVTFNLTQIKPASGAGNPYCIITLGEKDTLKTVKVRDTSETFDVTYQLAQGQHYAILNQGIGYYVSGSNIASDGYDFNVSIEEGYETTADFAVKVNGETVASQPGNILVEAVTEDLVITVEGVAKVAEDTDITVTVDLTYYSGAIGGNVYYTNTDNATNTMTMVAGEVNTLAVPAAENRLFQVSLNGFNNRVLGWNIDGTDYLWPTSYTSYTYNGAELYLDNGYLDLYIRENASPMTIVLKPILQEADPMVVVSDVPAFVENNIKVENISIMLPEVESYAWDGDTLNVVLPEGTAADAAFDTVWTIWAKSDSGNPPVLFNFNSEMQIISQAEGAVEKTVKVALNEGVASYTAEIAQQTNITFTSKTYTINFSIAGNEPEPAPTAYPITIDETIVGGTVTVTNEDGEPITEAAEGDVVMISATPAEGYTFQGVAYIVDGQTTECANGAFNMPAAPVTVTAVFKQNAPAVVPNPITEIEVKHPNITVDEQTNEMAMTIVGGVSEKLDLNIALENTELAATQEISWTSTNANVAWVEDGILKTGTVTEPTEVILTAIAVDKDPGSAAMIDDEGPAALATLKVTVNPTREGYTVNMGEDVEAVTNSTVSIPVTIGHTDTVKVYNAFDFTFEYDPTVLELTSTDNNGITFKAEGNQIHVERYGIDQTVGSAPFALTFKALNASDTSVKVITAKVDISEMALTQDAPDASVIDDITLVTVTGYPVTLAEGLDGAASVQPGDDYTFSVNDKNYIYDFEGSTMGGEPVTITEIKDENGNGTGVYKIENVTGAIDIKIKSKTGKTFNVTLGADMTGAETAQYMAEGGYTATLTKTSGYGYTVTVTIGGEAYTSFSSEINEDGTVSYTIPGEAITGDIVFDSAKTAGEFTVTFTGTGAGEAHGASTATAGQSYSFTINNIAGVTYNVTYVMGDAEAVELNPVNGTYTIENVTGNLVITINRITDLAVEVKEYVTLNGKTTFLVTATQTLAADEALSYDGTVMYYSERYNAWAYLVIVEEGTLEAVDAKAKITHGVAEKTILTDTYNVNGVGTVDINDAQLVFDMYNNEYQDFTTATMDKFLNADTNGDKELGVADAAAIVAQIIAAKNPQIEA